MIDGGAISTTACSTDEHPEGIDSAADNDAESQCVLESMPM